MTPPFVATPNRPGAQRPTRARCPGRPKRLVRRQTITRWILTRPLAVRCSAWLGGRLWKALKRAGSGSKKLEAVDVRERQGLPKTEASVPVEMIGQQGHQVAVCGEDEPSVGVLIYEIP